MTAQQVVLGVIVCVALVCGTYLSVQRQWTAAVPFALALIGLLLVGGMDVPSKKKKDEVF